MPTPAPIRVARFKRRGFNNVELEAWRRRTRVAHIFTVRSTDDYIIVTYR